MNISKLSDLEVFKDIIYLIDIDGVICRSFHYDIDREINQKEYLNHKLNLSCDIDSVLFIQKLIQNNIEFYFLTGRSIEIKQITENMFIKANLGEIVDKIIYNDNKEQYSLETFMNHKINNINIFRLKGKRIIVIDDHNLLVDCINYLNLSGLIAIQFNLPYIDVGSIEPNQDKKNEKPRPKLLPTSYWNTRPKE